MHTEDRRRAVQARRALAVIGWVLSFLAVVGAGRLLARHLGLERWDELLLLPVTALWLWFPFRAQRGR